MCSWFPEDLSTPISFKPIKDYSLDNLLYVGTFLYFAKILYERTMFLSRDVSTIRGILLSR